MIADIREHKSKGATVWCPYCAHRTWHNSTIHSTCGHVCQQYIIKDPVTRKERYMTVFTQTKSNEGQRGTF